LGSTKQKRYYSKRQRLNPTPAFDVKGITSKNTKGVLNYITKYVTKNESQFRFLPWNCSKKFSELNTSYYSDFSIISQLEKLETEELITIKRYKKIFVIFSVIPIIKQQPIFAIRCMKKIKASGIIMRKNLAI